MPEAILVVRIGDLPYAVALGPVERVLSMAALVPLPDPSRHVVGLLNLHDAVLPVVDPRPRLGRPTPPFHPAQRLIVVQAVAHFLLWVDSVERITVATLRTVEGAAAHDGGLVPFVAHVNHESIPYLSLQALDPSSGAADALEPTR